MASLWGWTLRGTSRVTELTANTMKKIQFVLLAMLIATAVCHGQPTTDPGWFQAENPVSIAEPRASFSETESPNGPNTKTFYVPTDPIAEAITPQIQALADALQDDPRVIFNYV